MVALFVTSPRASAQDLQTMQVLLGRGSGPGADGAYGDGYGEAIAADGDTTVIGVSSDNIGDVRARGSVYVYTRQDGQWSLQAKLTNPDLASRTDFGSAVALHGNTLVVGAALSTTDGHGYAGAAHVFAREDGEWHYQRRLVAPDPAPGDAFGLSVAVFEGKVLIGAPTDDETATDQGAAYLFERISGGWTQGIKLRATSAQQNAQFGAAVALHGDLAAVGAPFEDASTGYDQGAVYVFESESDGWPQRGRLVIAGGIDQDWFGRSVLMDANTLVVGADGEGPGNGPGTDEGAVFVYARTGAQFSLAAKLKPPVTMPRRQFGRRVALSGDTIAIAHVDSAGVQIYTRGSGQWPHLGAVLPQPAPGVALRNFGNAVAIAGERLLIGANNSHTGPLNSDQGAVLVHSLSAEQWPREAVLTSGVGAQYDRFGYAVAMHGDTALISSGEPFDLKHNGAVHVFDRVLGQWFETAVLHLQGPSMHEFGQALAVYGNWAMVGVRTVAVNGTPAQGRVAVLHHEQGNWIQVDLLEVPGTTSGYFNMVIAMHENGALIGAPETNVGENLAQGAAYLYQLDGSKWTLKQQIIESDGATGRKFGSSVALSGKVAAIAGLGPNGRSRISTYTRAAGVSALYFDTMLYSPDELNIYRHRIALFDETLLMGVPGKAINGNLSQGAGYVFNRVGGQWMLEAELIAPDGGANHAFGEAVALHGNSAILGAPYDVDDSNVPGRAYLFSRMNGAWTFRRNLMDPDRSVLGKLGAAVAMSGDTALIAAPDSSGNSIWGNLGEGRVYAHANISEFPDRLMAAGFE